MLSDASAYMNGAIISVDGGRTVAIFQNIQT